MGIERHDPPVELGGAHTHDGVNLEISIGTRPDGSRALLVTMKTVGDLPAGHRLAAVFDPVFVDVLIDAITRARDDLLAAGR